MLNKTRVFMSVAALAAVATAGSAHAQSFSLEGAVIDSRSSQNLGVVSERGDINALFRAQKAMTFGILRSAGISLEQLPPEVRARIERFQTNNVEAFRAFSQGLDLKDQGKFVEAKEFFRRAAELDPNFALASEQQRAMPDVNLGTSVQTRAVLVAAAGAAVDRGKASFTIDAARAAAALAAGQTVIITTTPTEQAQSAAGTYTSNPPGSSSQFLPNLAVAITYPTATSSGLVFDLATSNEYKADNYRVSNNVLDSVGSLANGFFAQRQTATAINTGSAQLNDGTLAYWGTWLSTPANTASVSVGGSTITAPTLGDVNYVYADATRTMPTTGTAVFSPAGGSLANASGRIAVDFVNRNVSVQNLGFTLSGLIFSGLNGTAQYAPAAVGASASGAFNGAYTSGTCAGCVAFSPTNASFGGNFVGQNANGLVFSTFLFTGPATSVSGVHLFKQ